VNDSTLETVIQSPTIHVPVFEDKHLKAKVLFGSFEANFA
jgi:hypothetical protein